MLRTKHGAGHGEEVSKARGQTSEGGGDGIRRICGGLTDGVNKQCE